MPSEKFDFDLDIIQSCSVQPRIVVERTQGFEKQYQKSTYKTKIKNLIKDIKVGHIYDDGPAGGDTHYLSNFSHKDSHVLSKSINDIDRLNYRVYEPELTKKPDGSWDYVMRVILDSCEGHKLNGTPDYVEDRSYAKMKKNKNPRNH